MTDTTRESGIPAPSRRALLGAAWSAPVIVAAGTAPAYAASAAATLVFDTFVAYPDNYAGATPNRIKGHVQIQRPWSATAPAVKSLTVTVPLPVAVAAGSKAVSVSGTGWAGGSVTGPANGTYSYTFTWTGTLNNTTSSTPELRFLVKRTDVAPTVATLTAYVTSPHATPTNRTIEARI
ncbi:exported hypothetical protein [metagenome]|uniref:Uncharacterized protein n=1 Tax=metagenome TaxID=256318 RepID=A0A2P2CHR9_9ZZZZ